METGRFKVVAINPHPELEFGYEQEALGPLGVEIERVMTTDRETVRAAARDADVVIPMRFRLDRELIGELTRCRLIPSGGIGVDHIDVTAATEQGILVTNMADTFVEEVANHAWMLLLMVARRGRWLHDMTLEQRWGEVHEQLFPILRVSMPRITGQTLGLISFGRIARAVARRAQAFGMAVVAYDPYVPEAVFEEAGAEPASLAEVCRRSDFVSCHLPLSEETHHLVGEEQFRLMKPSAIFISTGRGPVVDEAALIAALAEVRLAGAGLDVFEREPLAADSPLLRMPNVTLSPHIASVSDVSAVERKRLMGRQIADALQGKIPKGVVNPTVVATWEWKE
ncbi:MAG TPA: C-terminal binding protein [Chloroflexota bacterium]|nr:C-terminal binding protein [Chloroflexota bacterium]